MLREVTWVATDGEATRLGVRAEVLGSITGRVPSLLGSFWRIRITIALLD